MITRFSTFESIVKPLNKIKKDLQAYKENKEVEVNQLHTKEKEVHDQMLAAVHEVDKSKVVIKKVTDFLGD